MWLREVWARLGGVLGRCPKAPKLACNYFFLGVVGPTLGPFYPCFGEGSPSKIVDYSKKGTLILTHATKSNWHGIQSSCSD